MKALIIFTTILIFSLVIILPIGLTFGIKYIPSGEQPPLGNTQKIYKDITLAQSFISSDDILSGIGVSIKNPNFANKKDAIINIYDNENKLIRNIRINGKNIADGDFVKILFQPIENSKGKKFIWTISSPESEYEDALELFLTSQAAKWSLELKNNDEVLEETLPYVIFHKPNNSTQVMGIVLSDFFTRFREDKQFFVIYISFLFAILGLLFYPSSKQKKI